MSRTTLGLPEDVRAYLLQVSLREHEDLRALREATAAHEMAMMQISPEQGQLMGLLVRMLGARQALEVGTFTGYSALAVALQLPEDGRLVACDLSDAYTSIGRPHWAKAGVADKIDLRLGPALETLDGLLAAGDAGRFDFAFIDADKPNYDGYYERALKLVRVGGVIAIDNVLWSGSVADPANTEPSTEALRALNAKLHGDDRISLSMVPIGDGLTLCRRER